VPAPTRVRDTPASTTAVPRFLAFGLVVTVLYFAFPAYHLELWTPLGGSCVVATVVGIRRYKPRQALAWWLLAAAEFFFIAGDTSYLTSSTCSPIRASRPD
jgi:hypothetical protein